MKGDAAEGNFCQTCVRVGSHEAEHSNSVSGEKNDKNCAAKKLPVSFLIAIALTIHVGSSF